MKARLKPLKKQTMVITGASSGIGLSTARAAAKAGARLVLAARSEESLRLLCDELSGKTECAYQVTDVGDESQMEHLARYAVSRFGGFDTWINNAGVSVYGKISEVDTKDFRRLFDTNFWGVVYGSRVAARYISGGAIINVGSVLSDTSFPLQGMYSASKHAVKAFTDAFRMELGMEGKPISVTLIKPAAIDTPYPEHAKNYFSTTPKNPPPLYSPESVAEAILDAAVHPRRDIIVGGAGVGMSLLGSSRAEDLVMKKMANSQKSDKASTTFEGSLYEPSNELRERGNTKDRVMERSWYTKSRLHPFITSAIAVGTIGAGVMLATSRPYVRGSRP